MPDYLDSEATVRFTILALGEGVAVLPSSSGGVKLTREFTDEQFYGRDKLSALTFGGPDDPEAWRILYGLDNSQDRCQPLYLLVETRPFGGEWKPIFRGQFTLSECTFNVAECTVEVTATPDDGYREILENWDKPFNVLAYATESNRRPVKAQLKELSAGVQLRWKRIDKDAESDEVGVDGWTKFLTDKAWVPNVGNNRTILLFRYLLEGVPMVEVPGTTEFTPVDKSQQGYEPLFETQDFTTTPPTISYVKAPEISGFPRGGYVIGTYSDWSRKYGDQLLLLDCNQVPSNPAGYVQVTGSGGVNNAPECPTCLNARRRKNEPNCKSLWWRFGQFNFTRGFPLLDAIYGLLQATTAGTSASSVLPPNSQQLSEFFTLPVNPATGATGASNEIPGLLLSAASDVKRYGASEPATRVMVSLKTILDDLYALYDVGWFIDPATGWFRLEHRTWRETGPATTLLNLTKEASAILPAVYKYRTESLPRAEELTIASALTEELSTGVFFGQSQIDYSGSCVNSREGQNKSTRSASRLTGDVAGMVLSGDALPDSALVLLAPDPTGVLTDGNRKVAASELLKRYHRRGRVRLNGMVGKLEVPMLSLKPGKVQEGISYTACSLDGLDVGTRLTTNLGADAQLQKVELTLHTGTVTLSVLLPTPDTANPGPVVRRRAHNNAFNLAHG